jgi:hypothetical protein
MLIFFLSEVLMIKKKFHGLMKGKILLYNKPTEQKISLETITEDEELNLLIESTEPLIQCHVDRIWGCWDCFSWRQCYMYLDADCFSGFYANQ